MCDEDADNVIAARLTALGADLKRVFLWPRLDMVGMPRLPGEISRLEAAIVDTKAKFVVIDPIVAFLDRGILMNSDGEVRNTLRPLAALAQQRRCVILLVRHLNKRTGPNALYRGSGSMAFVAACRLAWIVGRDPRIDEQCVLAQAKNNYAPLQSSLTFAVAKDAAVVEWQGSSIWSADELSARRARPNRRRARDFLRFFLAQGPRSADEVWTNSRDLGLSENTLRRAKADLGITSQRMHREGVRHDFWLMPGQEVPPDPNSKTPILDDWLQRWHELYPPQSPLAED
jgi:hypothetical protein